MKAELLEKLLDAGFSKDEIIQLSRGEQIQHETVPETVPDPVPETENAATDQAAEQEPANPAAAPVTSSPEIDKLNERLTALDGTMDKLLKTIQSSNLRGDSFGQPADSLESQTDAIMQSIIRPLDRKGESA